MFPPYAALEQDQKNNDCGDSARRLRTQKAVRNWLVSELAVQSRVCKGTISKTERGDASPTAVGLMTFRVTLAGFLLKAENAGDPGNALRRTTWMGGSQEGLQAPSDRRQKQLIRSTYGYRISSKPESSFPQPGLVPAST